VNNDKPETSDKNESTAAPAGGGSQGNAKEGEVKKQSTPEVSTPSTAESAAKPQQPTSKPQPSKKSGASVVLWLLLIALISAAGAWWWFYGQHTLLQNQPEEDVNTDLRQELSQLRSQLSGVERAREALANRLETQILEQQETLNSQARRLRELSTTTRTDWLLAEAEYLLRLGNQRLLTERNSENALALLLSADDILRELDDIKLLPVREALARNIVALKSQPGVDREGLFIKLKVLAEASENLSVVPPKMPASRAVEPEPLQPTEAESPWYTPLLNVGRVVLAEAQKLVVVRRRDNPVDPLLSPEQEKLLRLQLGVIFKQSQLALLGEQQQVYEASLAEAIALTKNYFEVNDLAAQSLIEQLTWLQQQPVVQVRPDISEGLDALRDYIDSWHNRHEVESAGGAQQ